MPCAVHGFTTTGFCNACGTEMCARCTSDLDPHLCRRCGKLERANHMCYRHEFTRAVATCTTCGVPLCQGCRYYYKGQTYCNDCHAKFHHATPSFVGCLATLLALGALFVVVRAVVLDGSPPWLTSLLSHAQQLQEVATSAKELVATPEATVNSQISGQSLPAMPFGSTRETTAYATGNVNIPPNTTDSVSWQAKAQTTVDLDILVNQGAGTVVVSIKGPSGAMIVKPRAISHDDLIFRVTEPGKITLAMDNRGSYTALKQVELHYRAYARP